MKRIDIEAKIEEAFYYAVNFYSTNDRSIEKQRFCLKQLMDITGFDAETCCKIQTPVMNVFMMGELMAIGSEIANQHLSIITHNIRQHLLSIQTSLEIGVTTELPYIPKTESRKIAKVSSETDFAATCHGSIAVDSLVQHAVDENGKGKGADAIASIQRFNLSHNRLNDADATNLNNGLLGYTISAQTFNLFRV